MPFDGNPCPVVIWRMLLVAHMEVPLSFIRYGDYERLTVETQQAKGATQSTLTEGLCELERRPGGPYAPCWRSLAPVYSSLLGEKRKGC